MAYPTLNTNEVISALYNQIIGIHTFGDNVAGTYDELLNMNRIEGGLYGDTKLFIGVDALASSPWGNDAEAANLLGIDRPAAPATQAVVLDQFRQIRVTLDNYMTKRAFGTEGAFQQFNDVVRGWINDTKRIYESTLFNSYVGTTESNSGKQEVVINAVSGQNAGLTIAEGLANLLVDVKDVSRSYNDNGFIRSYAEGDLVVVWNSKFMNQITKVNLPVVFHKEGLLGEVKQVVLPSRYFGIAIDSSNIATYIAATPTTGKPISSSTGEYTPGTNNANGTVRALVEKTLSVGGTAYHVFPGDELPVGAIVVGSDAQFDYGEFYIEDATVAFKLMTKRSVPFMSAMNVATSFFNARSLTENQYLTFGYNTLAYLKDKPFVTARYQ